MPSRTAYLKQPLNVPKYYIKQKIENNVYPCQLRLLYINWGFHSVHCIDKIVKTYDALALGATVLESVRSTI